VKRLVATQTQAHMAQAMIATVSKEDLAVATGSERIPMESRALLIIVLVTYLFRTTGQVLGVR
jgi:hypothetical protein